MVSNIILLFSEQHLRNIRKLWKKPGTAEDPMEGAVGRNTSPKSVSGGALIVSDVEFVVISPWSACQQKRILAARRNSTHSRVVTHQLRQH